MNRTFIAYDTQSGRIVAAHHGPDIPGYEWKPQFSPDLQVAIVEGRFPELCEGKHYTFHAATRKLVETLGQSGTSFGFGTSGGTSSSD
jgi:hypothetical protein